MRGCFVRDGSMGREKGIDSKEWMGTYGGHLSTLFRIDFNIFWLWAINVHLISSKSVPSSIFSGST